MCIMSVCGKTGNHQLDNDTVCMQIMVTKYTHTDTHTHICCVSTLVAFEMTGQLAAEYLPMEMKAHMKKHKKHSTENSLKMLLY